jgi:hypothetical protein
MIEYGRRNFLKILGAAGTMALVCRDSVVSAASRAKNTLLAASKIQFQGIGLEPSSIERVEAPQIDVKVHADNFQIQEVRGNGLIDSRLTNGRLAIEINPIFDWDFGVDLMDAKENPADRFKKLGLTDEQARKVVDLIEKDFFKEEKPFEEPKAKVSNVRTGEGKDEAVVTEERVAAGVEIPLPSFRIPRIQPSINLNNLIINDINLQSTTSLHQTTLILAV